MSSALCFFLCWLAGKLPVVVVARSKADPTLGKPPSTNVVQRLRGPEQSYIEFCYIGAGQVVGDNRGGRGRTNGSELKRDHRVETRGEVPISAVCNARWS